MRRLMILPGACDALGGTLVTLSLLIQGFKQCGMGNALNVLVQANSVMHRYLQNAGQLDCLQLIQADDRASFLQRSLQWVEQQPVDHPLLLDNCVERPLLPTLLQAAFRLRSSDRPIYHFCHDLALSHNLVGYWLRKITFACLAPQAICNSQFTATHIRQLMPNIQGILYQPVDTSHFNSHTPHPIPPLLQPILDSGAKIILTPSRINQAGIINDKNLRALIPILVELKAQGHKFHSVVIGEDRSPAQRNSQELQELAAHAGVDDCFTILPPTFEIETYYRHADVVVTLAPREPFGRTVVEAIACGVPVIGSCTGGIGEILNQIAPEWAVAPQDACAAAAAIVRVTNTADTTAKLIQAMSWVQTRCSVAGYAQKLMEITGLTLPVRDLEVVQLMG